MKESARCDTCGRGGAPSRKLLVVNCPKRYLRWLMIESGALMVLVRNDNPSEFIRAGQTIMALPDPDLIKSIFNRHSPAHDGAIVINQDRITQMGCILPLSEDENLPTQYGTRHRAALGLSEVTDAVWSGGFRGAIGGGYSGRWQKSSTGRIRMR